MADENSGSWQAEMKVFLSRGIPTKSFALIHFIHRGVSNVGIYTLAECRDEGWDGCNSFSSI